MAAVILVIPKKSPKIDEFFNVIDHYLKSQGLLVLDNMPKTYFTEGNVSSGDIRSLIGVIKATKGYNTSVQKIFFTHNLSKM